MTMTPEERERFKASLGANDRKQAIYAKAAKVLRAIVKAMDDGADDEETDALLVTAAEEIHAIAEHLERIEEDAEDEDA